MSAPTLYIALKRLYGNNCKVRLFEHDKRFARFGSDFTFYDYKSPLEIPRDLRESFDVVFADPPFLSEECLTKTAVTVKFLAKEKIVLCTGKCFHLYSTLFGEKDTIHQGTCKAGR